MSEKKETSAQQKAMADNTGVNKRKIRNLLAAGLLLLTITSVLFLTTCNSTGEDGDSRLLDFNTVADGVRVSGIDISGMSKEEVLAATADIPDKLLSEITVSIDVNGTLAEYAAHELTIDTDYEEVIAQALSYGHIGSFEVRTAAASDAKNGLADFEVKVRADRDNVKAALTTLEQQMDKPPVDAAFAFTPNGHAADGSPYKSGSKSAPVRIAGSNMPSALRYQYYRTDKYVKNYIPKDASVARFYYTEEKDGIDVDIEALTDEVIGAIETKEYSITAPFQILKPTVISDSVKYATQLISSWTSSYESHDDAGRNYNIAKLSGIINGVVIKPGETWSINKASGSRTYANGWKGAPGILKGAYVTESGGGVCQVSSTVYNAALRAGLEIDESSRHSIISNYIPLGLDATISTGSKDLILRNPYDTPVFIVSYVNKKDKNVTVEIYGPPVMDGTHGQVILNFSSKVIERTQVPKTEIHYKAAKTPDGKPLDPGASKLYVKPRRGTTAQVYIHYISLDGKELEVKKFYTAKYPKITGHRYVNDAPPK